MKKSILIRPIEESDKVNYLKLFNSEDFGCLGMNSDLKPSIYEEEKIITGVINGNIISTAVLIIEDDGEFIGYTSISRPEQNTYHIGQFVIRKDKQRLGYGKALMDEVKQYAATDECLINLECISKSCIFFKKQGFINNHSSNYVYPRQKTTITRKNTIFADYSLIKRERQEQIHKESESFQKFLQSPIFKEIMKL